MQRKLVVPMSRLARLVTARAGRITSVYSLPCRVKQNNLVSFFLKIKWILAKPVHTLDRVTSGIKLLRRVNNLLERNDRCQHHIKRYIRARSQDSSLERLASLVFEHMTRFGDSLFHIHFSVNGHRSRVWWGTSLRRSNFCEVRFCVVQWRKFIKMDEDAMWKGLYDKLQQQKSIEEQEHDKK